MDLESVTVSSIWKNTLCVEVSAPRLISLQLLLCAKNKNVYEAKCIYKSTTDPTIRTTSAVSMQHDHR